MAADKYWSVWRQQPLADVRDAVLKIKREYANPVIFIPASDPYWVLFDRADKRKAMLWIQSQTAVPLYRGKLTPGGDKNRFHTGRGFSDYAIASAGVVNEVSSVVCWERFEGTTIHLLNGTLIQTC